LQPVIERAGYITTGLRYRQHDALTRSAAYIGNSWTRGTVTPATILLGVAVVGYVCSSP
jgi:hypothetical protein